MISEEKWVYTTWGYGKLQQHDSTKSVVSMTWGGQLYLSPSSTSDSIPIQIKPFTQSRSSLTFIWEITKDFSSLFKQVHKALSLQPSFQIDLYLPRGKLIQIASLDTPLSLKLKADSKLVAIARQSFTWDSSNKSPRLELLDDLITVRKKDESEIHYDSIKGGLEFSTGMHEWDIKLDFMVQYDEEEEVIVGVASKNFSVESSPTEGEFWGFMCLSCRKVAAGVNEEFGEKPTTGDVISVRLEYKEGKGQLSFSKNGVGLGTAFSDVPGGVYPAVTLNYPKFQISLGKVKGL
jgi:hypothetical protein